MHALLWRRVTMQDKSPVDIGRPAETACAAYAPSIGCKYNNITRNRRF
jgi:hypothetical protein